ncbi:MAG TPA: energy transducer TonB [Acidobacteriaceae bacterium]|jgi:TonB family protein|nr:energy transducer TonB [Acidobacteriaceae bacterium]
MATDNSLKRGTFGLLPEPDGRMGSFGMSMIVNVSVAALLLLLTVAQVHQVQQRRYETTQLIFPVDQPKPYTPPVPKIHVIPPPPVVEDRPKIELPKPLPEPPKVAEVKMATPEMPKMEAAPPKRFTPPPQPKVGLFKSELPTQVANNRVAPTARTGGFGDPEGVHPNPSANRQATVAAVGAFNAAPGAGAPGAGAARAGSVRGVDFGSGVANGVAGGRDRGTIASAGFNDGVAGGTGRPGSHGTVAKASFGDNMYGSAPSQAARAQEPATTPIVVLAKPLPTYTAEARQLKIEGDVTLQVRFAASGQVEVLRILSGLGHGLDEQAKIAAERIRFKPATKDGRPVDEVSIIHVTFQMA